MQARVLIVHDSKATRRVLSAIVSSRWTVCGQAENGKSAVKKFRELKPDSSNRQAKSKVNAGRPKSRAAGH